jgi:class 3 adenylate cyclase
LLPGSGQNRNTEKSRRGIKKIVILLTSVFHGPKLLLLTPPVNFEVKLMPVQEPARSESAATVAHTEATDKAVVVVDLSRYSDIARELEQHVGAPAVRELNAQIQGFIANALKAIGLAGYQLPYKNTGDGAIIALDTAEQASRFAEALHQAAQAHNLRKEVPLAQRHFRVGIWTDAIILNRQANAEGQFIGFEMAGTAVANAVRLEGACRTGEVLIGPDTWGDLPKAMRKQYGDQEEVKGKRGERFRAHRRKVVNAAPWEQAADPAPVPLCEPAEPPSIEDQPTAPVAPPSQKSAGPSVRASRPQPSSSGMQLTLLYKRQAQPDQQLLKCLEDEFTLRGHQVFVDRHLTIGVEWAKELESKIRGSDAIVLLLSAASVQSEMLAYEVQLAHDEAQKRQGKPVLLPVRVNYEDKLPAELASILDRLQYFLWTGSQDNARLLSELHNALQNPPAIKKIPPPAGVVPSTRTSTSPDPPTRPSWPPLLGRTASYFYGAHAKWARRLFWPAASSKCVKPAPGSS